MSVTLITTTGSRPEAFNFCEKYIQRQKFLKNTKENIQWIVIDDNIKQPTICTLGQEYYANPMQAEGKFNTQRPGLAFALTKVKGDNVFIIEDDDFYFENYIEVYNDFLKHAFLVGEGNALYYDVKSRLYKRMENYKGASLCQTAFRKTSIATIEKAVHSGELYIDSYLWARKASIKSILFTGLDLSVGIKGMPGRAGIGVGHKMSLEDPKVKSDKDLLQLPQFLESKQDAERYRNYYVKPEV